MKEYYRDAARRYLAAPPELRKASREHWTRHHVENLKSGRQDLIIFSAQILAAYDAADADPESISSSGDAEREEARTA